MSETNKMLADVLAEMREIRVREFQDFADHIEAAHKREVDKLNSVIQAQRGAFDAEQDRQRRAAPGDAAAMREVVMALAAVILPPRDKAGEGGWLAWVRAMQEKARAALAKPPRQCDVGTAEEQYSRMLRKCYEWMCIDCKQSDKDFRKCAISWAQMPYKEGESDGSK